MVKTEPKFTVVLREDFGDIDLFSGRVLVDLGDKSVRLHWIGDIGPNGSLSLLHTPELLALRLSVLKGEANPGLLADLVEELQGNWIEGHYGADLILAKLRECW